MNDKAAREADMVAESRVTTFVCGISIYNVRSIASKQDSHFSLDGAKDKKHKKGLRLKGITTIATIIHKTRETQPSINFIA